MGAKLVGSRPKFLDPEFRAFARIQSRKMIETDGQRTGRRGQDLQSSSDGWRTSRKVSEESEDRAARVTARAAWLR